MAVILPIITEYNDRGAKGAVASLTKLSTVYAGVAIAGNKAMQGLSKAIQSASNLQESMAKGSVVFGESFSQIERFASTAADTIGQSKQQAIDAASTFAVFGKAAGMSGLELTNFSTSLTTLSSDFASFYNTSPEDAIEAIGAALRGESEPIRKYGVLLNDASLKQRAATMGIYDGEGALTAQQRTLAAYSEILAQSADAQGDFARTSEGLANTSRIADARMADIAATIGTKLLPTYRDYRAAASRFVEELVNEGTESESTTVRLYAKSKSIEAAIGKYSLGAWALKKFNNNVKEYAKEVPKAKTATEQWSDSMLRLERIDLSKLAKGAAAARRKAYEDEKKAEKEAEEAAKRRAAAEKRRAEEAKRRAKQAKEALKDLARSIREDLAAAQQDALDKYNSLLEESRAFAEGLRDQITGFVSLSDAVRSAGDSESDYNDALRERADAYAELNRLQAERQRRGFDINDDVTYDANEYANALKRVQEAEQGVTDAQAKRTTYAAAFAQQITDARNFANNLKALSAAGLGTAGIQQLLAIGPTAGNAVAKELLAGTGAMTISSLNADLASIASAGFGFGQQVASPLFDPSISAAMTDMNLLGQATVGTVNNQVTINVSGANPDAVVDALRRYMATNGAIPIRVVG